MSDQTGWISVHRKIKDSPIYSDSQAVHLWVHLLLSANHKDHSFLHNGKLTTVKRGQLLTGRQALSSSTGINESKVQRLLVMFEELKMIEQHTNSKSRYISITNYDLYQSSEQQVNNTRTTGEQQVNTNNNVNNENNVKQEIPSQESQPSLIDEKVCGELLLKSGDMFPIYESQIDKWESIYSSIDVVYQLKLMKAWLESNPAKRKTKTGMMKFINGWLKRANEGV